jgi:ribosomal protein S18 acetylase RimI-like enzyme
VATFETMSFKIRRASIADAPVLSRLGATTFRETFEADNTPEDMSQYIGEAFTPARQTAEITDPVAIVLVAETAAEPAPPELIGYAHLVEGPAPEAVTGHRPMELKRIYVARAWHGRRVAHALMEAVLDAARRHGAQTLWLGVWERNPRAVAFYRKYGFTRVGQQTFLLGSDAQTDWLFVRSLGEAAGD